MTIFLFRLNGGGQKALKAILLHLFIAWALHYLVIGVLTLSAFLTGHEIVPLNTLRLFAACFVFVQLTALFRIYFYVRKKHD
jgi:hypothetical protein